MISGQKIIAFTPCGRKRYMDILTAHVIREHAAGHIDEWVLFNNPYTLEDSSYARQLVENCGEWVSILNVGPDTLTRHPGQISTFYSGFTQRDCIYIRLDDDLCYIDRDAIPNLVAYRIAHPAPFLVYPTIINNTRTSFQLQQRGRIPTDWGVVEPILCAPTAWISPTFVFELHQKALAAIEGGTLVDDFSLPSEEFTDWEQGNISINCFAMFGKDMIEMAVPGDEEGYISRHRPHALGRYNARCGNAAVIHFADHTQRVFMDESGMLTDYAKLEPLPFRTKRMRPTPPVPIETAPPPPPVQTHHQRVAMQRALMSRNIGKGLRA